MTNLRQDPSPAPTLPPSSALSGTTVAHDEKSATPRAFVLTIRLSTTDSSGLPAVVSFNNASPAANLALDLIQASGGAPEPADDVLSAGFFKLPSALLAARRLLWALEGLAGPEAAAIFLHSGDDPAVVRAALQNASPRQFLLGNSLAESVRQLPGIALRETSQGGWRELSWTSPAPAATPADDEQALLRLIRERGRQDPCAPKPQQVMASAAPAHNGGNLSPAAAPWPGNDAPTRSFSPPSRWAFALTAIRALKDMNRKWLIVGGASAAVILLAAILIPFLVSRNHARTPAPPPAPATKATEPPAPPPASPNPATPPQATDGTLSKTPPKSTHGSSAHQARSDASQPGKPSGKCDLNEAEIPFSLNRAENDLHAGRLSEAQALFQRLQGCPSAREKALAGLERIREQRLATGSNP